MMSDTQHPTHDLANPCHAVLSPDLVGRRKALGVLFGAGVALLAGTESASAFFFRKPASPEVDLELLPAVWVEQQGKNLDNYIDFLAGLHLENIRVQQVIDAHAKDRGGVWNQLPHSSLWKNISPTLKAADRIARQLKVPVKEIVSAYRAPAYNARCSGARRASWHQTNFAVDISFPVRASVVTRTARDLRNKGLFRGGVGGYSSFTHIDSRGTNIDW
jgi:Peptidase M15